MRLAPKLVSSCVLAVFLASCSGPATGPGPVASEKTGDTPKTLNFTRASFSDLPGYNSDRVAEAFPALAKSCQRILKKDPSSSMGREARFGTAGQWTPACREVLANQSASEPQAREILAKHFDVWKAGSEKSGEGLFTGYYEASLRGSPTQGGKYQTPLHLKPNDLVQVDLGDFRPELKGQRIGGRVIDGRLKPYEDRADILAGKLPAAQDHKLVWVDDPIGAFFLQVQGSGVVSYPDGTTKRIGFDGQNGHVYTAIGKELVARGAMTKDEVSMPAIRAWLEAHPAEAADLMNKNRSYVFFKELDTGGPVGGEGTVLTSQRSLAVDYNFWSYGVPIFVDAEPAKDGTSRLQRLMVAQDTGGAIRGPIRGDFFWGYGPQAEDMAGHMKSDGQVWALLPKGVTP
jgi:membrane-bound lytic murein transglycosylase A